MSTFTITRRDLCVFLINNGIKSEDITNYLQRNYNLSTQKSLIVTENIKRNFLSKFNDRWINSNRTTERFLKKNHNWLNSEFVVTFEEEASNLGPQPRSSTTPYTGQRGRPSKTYEELSEKSKKRKNMELVQEYGLQYIHNAYVQGLRSEGESEEATLVSTIRNLNKGEKILWKKKLLQETIEINSFSIDEALALYTDLDISKAQYVHLRANLINKNCDILPSYNSVNNGKNMCYPSSSSIQIYETGAKVKLQNLLDHTVSRIMMINNVHKLSNSAQRRLKLFTKWGCDGASGQSQYKQVLEGENENISDANLFISSFVPLKLFDVETNEVLWKNPACSSVRYCRPILMEFAKETPDKTRSVVNDIRQEIENLTACKIFKNEQFIEINHELFLTMIDGKVAQVLTETSSGAVCTVCGAKPSEMNDLKKVSAKPENESAFEYGLSTLHAWIRCMELILHISYNLEFKKWSATSKEYKNSKKEKKKRVQDEFRTQMGLHIDKPRQGSGNSNDGNTARRFFDNYTCTATITGVDKNLIKRFYVILQTISSGFPVNADKFGKYTKETAEMFVEKYSWYYMPSSVHKLLMHGESIIKHFAILPIGNLSEDAQESRNKDYKTMRLHHARKCSRLATNEDVFHALLYTSDPYISSLRKSTVQIPKELFEEAIALLDSN